MFSQGDDNANTTGTLGRQKQKNIPKANDMMTEMAQRLQARRARAEGLDVCIQGLIKAHLVHYEAPSEELGCINTFTISIIR